MLNYTAPSTVEEAVRILAEAPGTAKVLSGGTDLLVQLRSVRPMAITPDAVAAIRQFQVLPHGDKGVGFSDQHLGQHAAGGFTCKFAQRIEITSG